MSANQPEHLIPRGYRFTGVNIGLKKEGLDFGLIASDVPARAAAVFTRNIAPGAPVIIGREQMGREVDIQAVAVNSKNSNVATGDRGLAQAREVQKLVGAELKCPPESVFVSSTGVIGRQLPLELFEKGIPGLAARLQAEKGADLFSRAIMTTDTVPKVRSARFGEATVWACAKGSGMIEPNMATMLAYIITDLEIDRPLLRKLLTTAVNKSFNRVSVDSDTSTSDTVLFLANGRSSVKLESPEKIEQFQNLLNSVCAELAREIARDGEGAEHLITVDVQGALDQEQALNIARLVVNSPLVKTAVTGADPNWGRLLMAIGKSFDERIQPDKIKLGLWRQAEDESPENELLDLRTDDPATLESMEAILKKEHVHFQIDLGLGSARERVWGCDLTCGYVRINADYTT